MYYYKYVSDAKKKLGRPFKYKGEILDKIIKELWEYIEHTEIPILAEFAYQQKIPRQYLYEIPELSDAIKILMDRKQSVLEHGALLGDFNSSMAIFSLKQMGWKNNDYQVDEKQVDLSEIADRIIENDDT